VELAESPKVLEPSLFLLKEEAVNSRAGSMMVASFALAFLQYMQKDDHDLAVEIQWVARLALPIKKR